MDHDVPLGGGGPQGLSGWGTADAPPFTAALGQQGQLNAICNQMNNRKKKSNLRQSHISCGKVDIVNLFFDCSKWSQVIPGKFP